MKKIVVILVFAVQFGYAQSIPESDASVSGSLPELDLDSEEEEGIKELRKIQLGLSFGFNFYTNGQQKYYVAEDSTLVRYGKARGVSAVLSGLLGYKLSENHSIFLNIPLKDLYADPSTAIGLFNQRIAGGLGYGYNVERLSFIALVNIMPYEKVIDDLLGTKKFEQEPFSTIETHSLPTSTSYSPSLTLGISYNFIGSEKGNSLF